MTAGAGLDLAVLAERAREWGSALVRATQLRHDLTEHRGEGHGRTRADPRRPGSSHANLVGAGPR
ncbi:hypothetical protein GCM10027047_27010 [Rhodococcus aerolatus]